MTLPKNTITVAMSDRAPVRIDPELWPRIAGASRHDGQVECQANHVWYIRVRQHDDGRRLVYGELDSGSGGVHIGWRGASAGFLVDAIDGRPDTAETVRAIRRVAGVIDDAQLGDECIADLPAERLD